MCSLSIEAMWWAHCQDIWLCCANSCHLSALGLCGGWEGLIESCSGLEQWDLSPLSGDCEHTCPSEQWGCDISSPGLVVV